jgi:Predicted transcriptional regulator
MLLNTYEKVTKLFRDGNGYRNAAQLKDAKVTTVQIKELVSKGILERVSHGHYWLIDEEKGKPENFEMLEACMVNPRAVICADSACYYHGLIQKAPERLSVATLKTDRSKMQLNFPVTRHYYSDLAFEQDLEVVKTPYGQIRIYALERSVCDTIRFRADIGIETVENIVQNYMKLENRQMGRLLAYADAMRVGKIVRTTLEGKKQAD